jgi:hypothetical protein
MAERGYAVPVVVQQQMGRRLTEADRRSPVSRSTSCPTQGRRMVGELFLLSHGSAHAASHWPTAG